MTTADFTYVFGDITKAPTLVTVTSRRSQVSLSKMVVVDDDQLLLRRRSDMPPAIADLIDLAAAIQFADRLSSYHSDHLTHRHLSLPIRRPDMLQKPAITEQLQDILHWFTGDIWTFDFQERKEPGRWSELQIRLEEPAQPVEVALWSGGLDALAGLYLRLKTNPEGNFTLCSGTNGNRYMQGVQRNTRAAIRQYFPRANIKLEQVGPRIQSKGMRFRGNFTPRTRGFVFLLLGTVMAYLEGQHTLYVYENGVGAINLAFTASAVGLDHSRAVHPVSLCQVSELVTLLLDSQFEIRNPFLYWTKAQMCQQLVTDQALGLIQETITCDRRPRDPLVQCGRCSSCVLRRQALLANGLSDQTYVMTRARQQGQPVGKKDGDFFRVMDYQVERMRDCIAAGNKWQALVSAYPDLGQIVRELSRFEGTPASEIQEHILKLYQQYVAEWDLPGLRVELGHDLLSKRELLALDVRH